MASRNPRRSSILKSRNSIGPEGSSGGLNIGNERKNDEYAGNMTTNVPVLHPKRVSFSGAPQVKEFGNNSNSSGEGSLSLSKSTNFNQTFCNMSMTSACDMDMDFEEYEHEGDKGTRDVPKNLCRTLLNAGDMSTIENRNLDEGQDILKKLTPPLQNRMSYSSRTPQPQVKEFGNSPSSIEGSLSLSTSRSFNQTFNKTMTVECDMDMDFEESERDTGTRDVRNKNLCRTLLNAADMSTIENLNLDEDQDIPKKLTAPLQNRMSYSRAPHPQVKQLGVGDPKSSIEGSLPFSKSTSFNQTACNKTMTLACDIDMDVVVEFKKDKGTGEVSKDLGRTLLNAADMSTIENQDPEEGQGMLTKLSSPLPNRSSYSAALPPQLTEFGDPISSIEGSLPLSKFKSFNQTVCNKTLACDVDMDIVESRKDKGTREVPKDLCRTLLNAADMSTIENQNLDEDQYIPKKLTPPLPNRISRAPQPLLKEFGDPKSSTLTSFNQTVCNKTLACDVDMDIVESQKDKGTHGMPKDFSRTLLNAADMSTIENQNLDEGQDIPKNLTPPLSNRAPQPQLKEFGSSNSTTKGFNNGTNNAIRPPQLHFNKKHQPEECRGILYGRVRSKPVENKQGENPSCFGPFGSSKTPVRRKFQGEERTQQLPQPGFLRRLKSTKDQMELEGTKPSQSETPIETETRDVGLKCRDEVKKVDASTSVMTPPLPKESLPADGRLIFQKKRFVNAANSPIVVETSLTGGVHRSTESETESQTPFHTNTKADDTPLERSKSFAKGDTVTDIPLERSRSNSVAKEDAATENPHERSNSFAKGDAIRDIPLDNSSSFVKGDTVTHIPLELSSSFAKADAVANTPHDRSNSFGKGDAVTDILLERSGSNSFAKDDTVTEYPHERSNSFAKGGAIIRDIPLELASSFAKADAVTDTPHDRSNSVAKADDLTGNPLEHSNSIKCASKESRVVESFDSIVPNTNEFLPEPEVTRTTQIEGSTSPSFTSKDMDLSQRKSNTTLEKIVNDIPEEILNQSNLNDKLMDATVANAMNVVALEESKIFENELQTSISKNFINVSLALQSSNSEIENSIADEFEKDVSVTQKETEAITSKNVEELPLLPLAIFKSNEITQGATNCLSTSTTKEVVTQSSISTAVIEKLVQAVRHPPKDVFQHLNLLVSIKDNLIEMPQKEWKEIAGKFGKFLGTNYIESIDIERRTEHSTDPLLRMGLKLGRERRQRKKQELSLAK